MSKEDPKTDNPGVRFPPPLIFFLTGLAGWFVGKVTGFLVFSLSPLLQVAALVLLGLGVVLFVWSTMPFLTHKTSLLPWTPDSKLLTAGPYRFSRNPMYAGMALLYLGLSLQLGSGLAMILILPVILVINQYVIKGEEAYLTRTFGHEYQEYQKRVRRWL